MNNCILMAEIVQEPQLRYTTEQLALTEMLVQFPGLRTEDPPATLKVVGWGNLAQDIQRTYHQGDRIILEGRLSMSTVERPEGFKEKRAELTVQRIHPLTESEGSALISYSRESDDLSASNADGTDDTQPAEKSAKKVVTSTARQSNPEAAWQPKPAQVNYPASNPEDVDDIPF